MSSTLVWEPIIDKGKSLSDELKFILREAFDEGCIDRIWREEDLVYLRGLRDGSRGSKVFKEILTLIAAIERYKAIRIYERYS